MKREDTIDYNIKAAWHAIARMYLPFAVVLRLSAETRARLSAALPFVAAMAPIDGKMAVYVCRDFACRPPATTMEELEGALRS